MLNFKEAAKTAGETQAKIEELLVSSADTMATASVNRCISVTTALHHMGLPQEMADAGHTLPEEVNEEIVMLRSTGASEKSLPNVLWQAAEHVLGGGEWVRPVVAPVTPQRAE